MDRRRLLQTVAAGTAVLAGCSNTSTESTATPASTQTGTDTSLPGGIYVQSFRESMSMQGVTAAGPYEVAFMYTSPHVFWNMTGRDRSRTPRSGDIHAMAVVWDRDTGRIVPETGLSLTVRRDGELVSEEVIYPMLSQTMGYHYGGNFSLADSGETPTDGEYTARISVGGVPDGVELTGSYAGRFREPATADLDFSFTETDRDEVRSESIDQAGQPGALRPMQMEGVPQATAPAVDALPGTVFGTPNSDDAILATGAAPARADGGDTYLYVSARTRYHGMVLPAMALSVERGGETVELTRTLDPELGYHYGASVPALDSGEQLRVVTDVPPQTARHEGYERAFRQMSPVTVTV
ncbi:DUF7350 domain-containing protein [Halosegnis longus]|uniref:DUF7350 domain-containing protein n=1 Tax=Halosegnis longus TaxID=2216012 RepID=UPI00129D50DA|nr:hypothetical protein [Halosegnis longus]